MNIHELDFTKGKVLQTLARFSFPILITNLLQSLYSIADMLVVGHFVGGTGLAAISNASMVVFLITSISTGFSMGGSVLVARLKGAGDSAGQKMSVSVLLVSAFLLSVAVMSICFAGYAPLFVVMEVPAKAMKDANEYMAIVSGGIVFIFGYNAVSAVLRGLGDSIKPFYFALVAAALNIVLDFILVGCIGYGTKGAALATVISQGVACVAGLQELHKRRLFMPLKAADFSAAKSTLKSIAGVGVPYAIQLMAVNFSYLVVTGMVNTYGLAAAAAAGVGLKLNTLAAMPCWAIGQAVTAMAAQNMGAGNAARVREVVHKGLFCSLAITCVLVLAMQIFARKVLMLFGLSGQEFIDAGVLYLRVCCSVNCMFYVAMYTFDSFALGAGAPGLALLNSLLDSLVLRLPFIWFLEAFLAQGLTGIYLGQALAPVIPAIIGAVFFLGNRWSTRLSGRNIK